MTYRSLKSFIKNNTQPNNDKIFDLISVDIKSKIIFVIGDGASNTSAYISAIMSACEIGHFSYTNKNIEINKKFFLNGTPIDIDLICENAEKILKTTQKKISNDDFLFCLSLLFCDSEYAIIEISEDYYKQIKDIFTPFAIILSFKDDKKSNNFIEYVPQGIKEIISLSKKENFDYISNKFNEKGTRITWAQAFIITIICITFQP